MDQEEENKIFTTPTALGSIFLGAGAGTAVGAGMRRLYRGKGTVAFQNMAKLKPIGTLMSAESWQDYLNNIVGGTVGLGAGYGYNKLQEKERKRLRAYKDPLGA
jgi:hypothetical protein